MSTWERVLWLLQLVLVGPDPVPVGEPEQVLLAGLAVTVLGGATLWVIGDALIFRRQLFLQRIAARQLELGRPLTAGELWELME